MKILLFLEYKFYISQDNNLYAEKVIDKQYLDRYLNVFDEITICARVSKTLIKHMPEPLVDNRISIIPLPDKSATGIMMNCKEIAKKISKQCSNYQGKTKVDGLIIRGPSSISYLAYEVYKLTKLPYVVEMVINPKNFFYDRHGLKGWIIGFIGTHIIVNHTKKLCYDANGVCYVTKHILQDSYPSRSIKQGFSDNNYFDAYALDVMLDENGFSNNIFYHNKNESFIICHTGWMVGENKGHRLVLQVLKHLIDDGLNCKIKFIGDGPMKNSFMTYAKELGLSDNVVFLGQVNGYTKLQKELATSHLFLFPSRIEGLPRAIVEAMANSLPVVSFDNDGIPELINSRYLAHVGDIEKLYTLTKMFYENEELRVMVANENFYKAHDYKTEIFDKTRRDFFIKFSNVIRNRK